MSQPGLACVRYGDLDATLTQRAKAEAMENCNGRDPSHVVQRAGGKVGSRFGDLDRSDTSESHGEAQRCASLV